MAHTPKASEQLRPKLPIASGVSAKVIRYHDKTEPIEAANRTASGNRVMRRATSIPFASSAGRGISPWRRFRICSHSGRIKAGQCRRRGGRFSSYRAVARQDHGNAVYRRHARRTGRQMYRQRSARLPNPARPSPKQSARLPEGTRESWITGSGRALDPERPPADVLHGQGAPAAFGHDQGGRRLLGPPGAVAPYWFWGSATARLRGWPGRGAGREGWDARSSIRWCGATASAGGRLAAPGIR